MAQDRQSLCVVVVVFVHCFFLCFLFFLFFFLLLLLCVLLCLLVVDVVVVVVVVVDVVFKFPNVFGHANSTLHLAKKTVASLMWTLGTAENCTSLGCVLLVIDIGANNVHL
jgi:hypothetical protein